MKNYWIAFAISSIFIASCGQKIKSKDELKSDFNSISNNLAADSVAANKFIKDALAFVNQEAADTNKVHFRKLIAETYTMQGKFDDAIDAWDQLRLKHSKHPLAAEALFKKAYLLSEVKDLKDASRPLYEEFIIKYPNHPLAETAQFQLTHLDKSNEQLLFDIMSDSTNNKSKMSTE